VTEQSGQIPDDLQEVAPLNGGDPQSEHAPSEHAPAEAQQDAAPPADPVPPAEAAPLAAESTDDEQVAAGLEPAETEKVAASDAVEPAESVPAKPKAGRSRKAAAVETPVVSTGPKSENMDWYILKVQSNREESIREGLLRRVAIQGLDRFFGEVIVPMEKVTEFKGGKKRVIKRKLYPGYLVVHMEINEDTWFLVRETPGIGDFTGASGVPSPMLPHEVERIVMKQEEKNEKAPDLKIPFMKGDRVKVIEGNFENFEGEVENIDKTNGRVTVMITIFNRTTPVEFEYWQVESL
jgi:transcriptional antiterminator NusG